jgi:hypothetical protein
MKTCVSVEELRDLLEETTEPIAHVEKLRLAQVALQFAIGLMEEVADETDNDHARAYLIDQLQVHAASGHGFLSSDFNLDDWLEQLEEETEEEDLVEVATEGSASNV